MKKLFLLLTIILVGFITSEIKAQTVYGSCSGLQVVGGSPNSITSLRWYKRNRPVMVYDTTNSIHYKFVGNATVGSRWKKAGTVSTGKKRYVGKLTQSSTDAPVLTATTSTTVDGSALADPTSAYTSTGVYTLTFPTAVLTSGKTTARFYNPITPTSATSIIVRNIEWTSTTVLTITVKAVNITTPAVAVANGGLTADFFEVEVWD